MGKIKRIKALRKVLKDRYDKLPIGEKELWSIELKRGYYLQMKKIIFKKR